MNQADQTEEGWRQVQAGVALVRWSKLVEWDSAHFVFSSVDEKAFESRTGHQSVHPRFGRLICWIAFSTGAEYLAKGTCFLNGKELTKANPVVRIPQVGENLQGWIDGVLQDVPSVKEQSVSFGSLGNIPLRSAVHAIPERSLIVAAYELLRSTVRNRDAHRYAENVRTLHFHVVGTLFVPAFNAILRSFDQVELRRRMLDARRNV